MLPRWEYLVLGYQQSTFSSKWSWSEERFKGKGAADVLNILGAEGWELASTIAESRRKDGGASGTTTDLAYIFKRQKA